MLLEALRPYILVPSANLPTLSFWPNNKLLSFDRDIRRYMYVASTIPYHPEYSECDVWGLIHKI